MRHEKYCWKKKCLFSWGIWIFRNVLEWFCTKQMVNFSQVLNVPSKFTNFLPNAQIFLEVASQLPNFVHPWWEVSRKKSSGKIQRLKVTAYMWDKNKKNHCSFHLLCVSSRELGKLWSCTTTIVLMNWCSHSISQQFFCWFGDVFEKICWKPFLRNMY